METGFVLKDYDHYVDAFVELFRGRADAYGSWEGGCVRKKLTRETFGSHISGEELIGVYPHVLIHGEWNCVWGCTDIDVEDLDSAANIKTAFATKGIPAWIERTRKGYHVWVFLEKGSIATTGTMRKAFLAVHQAINYPAKEVNPKQENPGAGFGNYVRLPYPGGIVDPIPENRYMLDDNEEPLTLGQFLEDVHKHGRASLEALVGVAQMYVEPVKRHVVIDNTSEDVSHLMRLLPRAAYMYWQNGPLDGRDRSTTLVRLAHLVQQSGLTPNEAYAILASADMRWGKFHLRGDGEEQIMKIVTHVYGG